MNAPDPNTLSQALIITAVGMGLVFAAILLLWALMAFIVKIAGTDPVEEDEEEQPTDVKGATGDAALNHKRRQAAALAVAIALADQASSEQPHEFPLPPTAVVSAWQAIMRTRILNKRGPTR